MIKRLGFSLLLVAVASCGRVEPVPYETLLGTLTNLNKIARLDVEPTELISSSDLTGANEDYNHFQGRTGDGQVILADLKGPGVVSRFWMTGIPDDKKVRFYFDGEKQPRLEFSWRDLRMGYPPFDTEPVSIDEQNCWHTYLPIPFRRRLRITSDDAGYQYGRSPKFYYQINWQRMPPGRTVESLVMPMPSEIRDQLQDVAQRWADMDFGPVPPAANAITVGPGETRVIWQVDGPAAIQALSITPDLSGIPSAAQRDQILRDVRLAIHWDGRSEPSVLVPLGDFFGSVWQRWRASSMLFGTHGDTFFSRFPMPFAGSARISIENQSGHALSVAMGIALGEMPPGDWGYFHSGWTHSRAADVGRPHQVLSATGEGRFAGCFLSVVSQDRSFWVLESDEIMYADGSSKPFWIGTGLEDYFNAGWYYGNVFSRPLHGLPNKAPFRTVQYRLHLPDPVLFRRDFQLVFERGPDHASRADYESVSYYYLRTPSRADTNGHRPEERRAPTDPLQPHTLMTDLFNFERIADWQGQIDYIDRYLETYQPPFSEMLRLRRLVCVYEKGTIALDELFQGLDRFAASEDEGVRRYAVALRRLHTEPDAALVQFYSNMAAELFLNGRSLLRSGNPQQPVFELVELASGKHTLAIGAAWQSYPSWVQVAIRTAKGLVAGTSSDWVHAVNPVGNWRTVDYRERQFSKFVNYDARVKGPPEEPFIWINPDPFVNTLSQTAGLRPSVPWPDRQGQVVYRHAFEVP